MATLGSVPKKAPKRPQKGLIGKLKKERKDMFENEMKLEFVSKAKNELLRL